MRPVQVVLFFQSILPTVRELKEATEEREKERESRAHRGRAGGIFFVVVFSHSENPVRESWVAPAAAWGHGILPISLSFLCDPTIRLSQSEAGTAIPNVPSLLL